MTTDIQKTIEKIRTGNTDDITKDFIALCQAQDNSIEDIKTWIEGNWAYLEIELPEGKTIVKFDNDISFEENLESNKDLASLFNKLTT